MTRVLFSTGHNFPTDPLKAVRLFFTCFLVLTFFATATPASVGSDGSKQVDPKQVVRSAEKLIQKGNFEQAEQILRGAIADYPTDSTLKLELAFTLMKMRVFTEAYNLGFSVAQNEPTNAHAFAVLGTVLLTGGRLDDSRAILLRALTMNRKESLALASFGLLEFYENRLDSSLDYLFEAKFIDPSNADYIFAYAQVAARAERYQEAAAAYRQFLIFSKITDDDRRERIKGLINFLEYLGLRTSLYAVSGTDSSTVSFDLKGNRPVVLLKVNNGKDPLRFVLDTGSGISVISNQTAKRLKIKEIARGGFAKGIGGTGKFEIVYGFLKEVQLGTVRVKNVPVYIREFHHNIHEIDGYIGISLISKFLTTVDYGEKTFTLNRLNTEVATSTMSNNISLPLRLVKRPLPAGQRQERIVGGHGEELIAEQAGHLDGVLRMRSEIFRIVMVG